METTNPFAKGELWISINSWGDIEGLSVKPDEDKKVIFEIIDTTKRFVKFKISYCGNPFQNKIYKNTIKDFINECKPKNLNMWLYRDFLLANKIKR